MSETQRRRGSHVIKPGGIAGIVQPPSHQTAICKVKPGDRKLSYKIDKGTVDFCGKQ